jgi:hypothetical protein
MQSTAKGDALVYAGIGYGGASEQWSTTPQPLSHLLTSKSGHFVEDRHLVPGRTRPDS